VTRERGPAADPVAVVRKRVVIHGRVQGVFFRETTRRRAEARVIAGWVWNRPDGAVEVVLEGERGSVDSLVRFCHEGPRGAEVERVEVTDEEPEGLRGFVVH
jgi:acylphosphatase